MGADGGDPAFFEHRDAVGAANGAQAMRNHQHGAALHQVPEGFLDQRFAFGIERGGGFVEDEDGRILQDRAGNGDALALATRKPEAFFADHRVVALRKAEDEIVGQGVSRGLLHQIAFYIRLAVGDVVAHRVVEKNRFLGHLRNLAAQRRQRNVANVFAVDDDSTRSYIEETRNEVHERRLACPAGPDQRQHFAGAQVKIDVVQDLVLALFGRIGETDVFKSNGPLEGGQGGSVRLFLHVVLDIEKREDGDRCAHGLLKLVVIEGEPPHRIVKLEQGDDESDEDFGGHAAVLNLIAANPQQQGDGHRADGVHQRRTDRLDPHTAQVGAEQAPGGALETKDFPKLCVERLHDAITGNGLVQDVLDFGELVLAGAGAGSHGPAYPARGGDHHRDKQHQRPAKPSAERNHQRNCGHKCEELLEEIAQHRADRHLHPVDVIDEGRQYGPGGMAMKEAGRTTHDGFVQVIAHIGHQTEARVVDQVGAGVIANPLDHRRHHQGKRHHNPRIVHPGRNELVQIESPLGGSKREQGQSVGGIARFQYHAQDGHEEGHPQRIKHAHRSQKKHTR